MKTSTKLAVAFVTLAGIGAAALSAQADSRWNSGDGGSSHMMQQAHGGGQGMRFHGAGHGDRHAMQQGMRHGGGHHGSSRMFRMMESFDSDGDGKLSQEEIDQTRSERFGGFDADGDKTLTLAEYEKLWLDAMREKMVDRFQHLDADGDGQVTAEEFKAPYAKMVRRMDHNEDGVIDRDDSLRRHRGGPMQGDNG